MIVLGIESTAHTFGIGITNGKKILCNVKDIYVPKEGWGIVPGEAAKHHESKAQKVLEEVWKTSGISSDEVNFVALSTGPGLPPCLLSGLKFAKSLSENIPFIPVNHCVAHIEIGKFDTGCKDPLTVYVSGGNTQITALEGRRYRIFGETLDIGIGNAIDKFAREAGLSSPGGPHVEELAREGKKYIELPYTVKGMDLVFSGLVTAASKNIRKTKKKDLTFSFQETIFSMLVEVSERALAHTKKKEVLLTGGVAQNKRLQEMFKKMCKEHDAKFFVPKPEFCSDNGAMIAWTGFLSKKPSRKLDINPRWRTDEVEITW